MRRYIPLVIIYAVLLGAGMAIGSYVHHQRSLVTYAVTIPKGSVVKVYADQGGDTPYNYNPSKPLHTLSSDGKITAKVGVYDFVIQNSKDYETNVKKVTVNKGVTLVAVNPSYSTGKLDLELAANRSQIIAALNNKFKDLPAYYGIGAVKVYEQGEWAGVSLVPKSDQYDPVRFVLNKKGSEWSVVNSPSIFVVGSRYKNIPPLVVSSTNSL